MKPTARILAFACATTSLAHAATTAQSAGIVKSL
jgi:hypothetical protein